MEGKCEAAVRMKFSFLRQTRVLLGELAIQPAEGKSESMKAAQLQFAITYLAGPICEQNHVPVKGTSARAGREL